MENIPDSLQTVSDKPKKRSLFKRILAFIKWAFISVVILLISLVSLVFIYEDEVKKVIITELNRNLNAELRIEPHNIQFTIIRSFPDCALEFKEVTCMEAIKKQERDTLFYTDLLQLRFSIRDLWEKKYAIKKLIVSSGFCRLKVNSKGLTNYQIWKETVSKGEGRDSLTFKLELIRFNDFELGYHNRQKSFNTALSIHDLAFSGNIGEENYQLNAEGSIFIELIAANKINYLKNKDLKLSTKIQVLGKNYQFEKCDFSLNRMNFITEGNCVIDEKLVSADLLFKASNLDFQSILSLIKETKIERLNDYKSEGEFYASGNLKYKESWQFGIDFGIKNTNITYVPENITLQELNTKGRLEMNESSSILKIDGFSANLLNDKVNGNFTLKNFNDPELELSAKGSAKLQNLLRFWPIDTIQRLRGDVNFEVAILNKISDFKANKLSDNGKFDVAASLRDLSFQLKGQTDSTNIKTCSLKSNGWNVEVQNLSVIRNKSDILINGYIEGVYAYLLNKESPLEIKGELKSSKLFVEDFLFNTAQTNHGESKISVSENIHFILDAEITEVKFGKFIANNLRGNLEMKKRKLMTEGLAFETMSGSAQIEAVAEFDQDGVELVLQSNLNRINIKQLFEQLNNFDQVVLTDKQIEGVLTASIDFSGNWNANLISDLNSVQLVSDLIIEKGRLFEFKPLESLSKFVDIKDLRDIRFSDLKSHVEIQNKIITISKTNVRNSALNIDFWGTHTFDNTIDYHLQLLISELLAKRSKQSESEFGKIENDPENRRSAYILMTGNIDNIKVKFDRKGLKEKIKEDIQNEKKNIKAILNEEFGLFKKDTTATTKKKSDQKFELENPNKKKKREEEEEDDDF